MPVLALTRPVSESIARCELTFSSRTPIDVRTARKQHSAYEQALRDAGCTVERLPGADTLPDAVFVEDIALVLDEVAIITRPGAVSRRAESSAIAERLAELRPLAKMAAPATLDGGDVLRVGRTLYVGRSTRTNRAGHEALTDITAPLGYEVIPIEIGGCLHLKSAASWLGEDRVLVDPARVRPTDFHGLETFPVPEGEGAAANALRVGDTVLVAEGFPRTRSMLENAGVKCHAVANTELAKAEGGLTCCSLLLECSGMPGENP